MHLDTRWFYSPCVPEQLFRFCVEELLRSTRKGQLIIYTNWRLDVAVIVSY